MQDIKILDWDSKFFGYKVCSIRPVRITMEEMGSSISDLRKNNTRLLYCFVDPGDKISIESIKGFSGIHVDSKVTYYRKVTGVITFDAEDPVRPYKKKYPSDNLIKLALESGVFSRFKIDPGFKNNEYERLYTEWIVKSVSKEISDLVLVYYDDNTVERGFVTLKIAGGTGTIGLIAVDESMRGKSIGKKLMTHILAYLQEKGIGMAEVATQKANDQACKFYDAIGFKIKDIINVYHIWIS